MAYILITDEETDPEAPLTSELAKKWRDNPEAIAAGLPGAPRVKGQALDTFLASGTDAAILTITDLGDVGWIMVVGHTSVSGDGESTALQIRFSTDNGSSWGAWQAFVSASSGGGFIRVRGDIFVNLAGGAVLGLGSTQSPITVPTGVNAVGVQESGSGSAAFGVFALSARVV